MATELGPKRIRVHAVSPGPLATRAESGIRDFDELMARVSSRAPVHRLVAIDEIGAACVFLASSYATATMGSSRQRRVILLRRKLDRSLAVVDRTHPALPQLSFAEVAGKREVREYAALVTSLPAKF